MSVSRELLGSAGGKSAEDTAWPLLAAALEETGDGLIIVRAAGDATRIVFCNRAFTDLTGFAAGEALRQRTLLSLRRAAARPIGRRAG